MMNENDKGADELPQYVVDLLKKVAENERIEGFVIDIRSGSSVGDGYLSNLKSVVMRGKRTSNNGDSVELHLLCKMLTDSERACEEMNLNDLFEREIFFYSVVFPALEKFQTSRGITSNAGFFAYPKCYETVFNSEQRQMALIMGDLRRSDFKMWPKQQPADIGHVELVFRQLAKFHGVSFAMKDQEPSTFNRLRSTELFSPLLEKKSFASYFDASHQKCIQGLEKTLAPARFERVKAIFANSRALLKKTCNGLQSEPYSVLIHGDSWSNNFLFRYEQVRILESFHFHQVDSFSFLSVFFLNSSPVVPLNYDSLIGNFRITIHRLLTYFSICSPVQIRRCAISTIID